MKSWKDPTSPWGKKLWYEDHEFRTLMEDALRRGGEDIFTAGSGVDVDRILEHGYGITPDYAADLPADALGRTLFHRNGTIEVHVQRSLADEAGTDTVARRRLRSTIAHELAHVVLHSTLYPVDHTQNLFGFDDPPAKVLCRSGAINGQAHDWWEHQAYRGMACVLIPSRLLDQTLPGILRDSTVTDAVAAGKGKEVITTLADIFDTSFELTLYRLQELSLLPSTVQPELTNLTG